MLCLGASAIAEDNFLAAENKYEKLHAVIFGTVWGPDDHPYGVKVKTRRENEKKARWDLYSDHSGEFAQRVPTRHAGLRDMGRPTGHKSENGKQLQEERLKYTETPMSASTPDCI
jgi:hypothetical protein